jgi:SAM-dependent methyltransferase
MNIEEFSKLFDSVPNFQNLYQVNSDSNDKVISYPSDAFAKTESENQGFWAQARLVAIKRAMNGNRATQMVEVGAGGGAVCIALTQDNFSIFAIEPHLNGAMTIAKSGVPVLAGFLHDADFPDGSVPNYGTFDVLEHLPEPDEMLQEMFRTLDDDGHLYLTVPVGQWLWGSLDDTLGHQQRFSKKGMRGLLERNGFVPEHEEFLFLSLVPLAWLTRALPYKLRRRESTVEGISDQLAPNKIVDYITGFILKIEAKISRLIRLPYGLTLLVVARKSSIYEVSG